MEASPLRRERRPDPDPIRRQSLEVPRERLVRELGVDRDLVEAFEVGGAPDALAGQEGLRLGVLEGRDPGRELRVRQEPDPPGEAHDLDLRVRVDSPQGGQARREEEAVADEAVVDDQDRPRAHATSAVPRLGGS